MNQQTNKSNNNRILLPIMTWGLLLLVWLIYSVFSTDQSVMIPSIKEVWQSFLDIVQNGYGTHSFAFHLRSSFVRLFLALFFGVITGVPLGFISGYVPVIRGVVDSLIQFYRPIPPLAYYPLLIIWMGIGDGSKIFLLYLAAFAPIYIACVSAIGKIRHDYLLTGQSLGANKFRILKTIIWPATLPEVFTGFRTAFGFAYSTLVAAEMTASTSGIGWMVMDASRYLKSDVMFVGIVIMGLTGVLIDVFILFCERHLVFWKGRV